MTVTLNLKPEIDALVAERATAQGLTVECLTFRMIGRADHDEVTRMKWRVLLQQDPETGDWAVWCPELPGCASAGETEEEAMNNIREAIELYLQHEPLELAAGTKSREITL